MAKAKATENNKAEDLVGKSADELNALLLVLRKKQMDMRFQQAAGQMTNTSEVRVVRRTIARVKTFLGQNAAQAAK
ncbi:MAG: 50S ribosomal protein L29 [Pseudomonadota bacterium]|mgnify:CR=1 FL=1